jgi:hypothetical protein
VGSSSPMASRIGGSTATSRNPDRMRPPQCSCYSACSVACKSTFSCHQMRRRRPTRGD